MHHSRLFGFTTACLVLAATLLASPKSDAAEARRYQVTGSRQGQVIVTDTQTNQVIHTFQMDKGVVVRETFLLDGGKTVAASQKDHAVFWDLATGREIARFPERIYGFSNDESKFFTFPESKAQILLYNYPSLKSACKLSGVEEGPWSHVFSPSNQFLAIDFGTGKPERDEYFPKGERAFRAIFYTRLFNLKTCQEIKQFNEAFGVGFNQGEFSKDSRFFIVKTSFRTMESALRTVTRSFDLRTYEVQKLSD